MLSPLTSESLEPGAEPILALVEIERESIAAKLSELARMPVAQPMAATRTALFATPIVTRADALAAMSLLANSDDAPLTERAIAKMTVYLSVM